MTITLRQMQYAIALAETGHFGRAAERCNVTQPALSQQIRQLEDRCGGSLFDRLGRSVQLTPLGREFVGRARPIVERSEELADFVSGQRGHPDRPLRFGMIPTVAPYLLPHVYPGLQEDLPDLAFTVHEKRTEALLEGLEEGQIDLALIATEPLNSGPRLTVAALYPDEFVLATALDEPPGEPVNLSRLDTDRMLLLDEGHCFRDQAMAACDLDPESRAGPSRPPRSRPSSSSWPTVRASRCYPRWRSARKPSATASTSIASPRPARGGTSASYGASPRPMATIFKSVAESIVRHRPDSAPQAAATRRLRTTASTV